MKDGKETLVWVRDSEGKEYACYFHDIKRKIRKKEELTPEEISHCLDISQIHVA